MRTSENEGCLSWCGLVASKSHFQKHVRELPPSACVCKVTDGVYWFTLGEISRDKVRSSVAFSWDFSVR